MESLCVHATISTTLLAAILDGIDGRMAAITRTTQTEPNDIYKENCSANQKAHNNSSSNISKI